MITLDELVAKVDAAIAAHQNGGAAPFSASMLRTMRAELENMRISAMFNPTYTRFVLDWPDASGELGKALIAAAYARQKTLKRRG